MDNKNIQIIGTGVLLTTLVAGGLSLKQRINPSTIQPMITITPYQNDGNFFNNLVEVDIGEICSIATIAPFDDYLLRLSSLMDSEGKPLFSCSEKLTLLYKGADIGFIEELANMKNPSGKNFFKGQEIIAYRQAGGTVEYASEFVSALDHKGNFIFRGNQMVQFYALNVKLDEVAAFNDTPKPNALVIYPTTDQYGVFANQDVIAFHDQLKQAYDLRIEVAEQEQEVYTALEESVNFELLVLFGHGIKESLSLGENDLRELLVEKNETYTIDVSDNELEKYLPSLHPSATIFLYSCSTGSGWEKENNLANKMASWAKGRTVIASQEVLQTNRVNVDSIYPLEVRLLDETGNKEITYVVSGDVK